MASLASLSSSVFAFVFFSPIRRTALPGSFPKEPLSSDRMVTASLEPHTCRDSVPGLREGCSLSQWAAETTAAFLLNLGLCL